MTDEDISALAQRALSELDAGARLRGAIETAVKIAALRGHVAEEVWLRLQLVDLPPEEAQPTKVPEVIESVWNIIGASEHVEVPREMRLSTVRDHFDSRTPSATPGKLFTKKIDTIEDLVEKCDILEADERGIPPHLVAGCIDAREVYERVRSRVRDYVSRHV